MNEPQPYENLGDLPHILVVDDDDRIRDLVARYLRDHGFFVSTAQDASQAKAILEIATYDALVLDVMMPGQTGTELTTELRASGALQQDVPILMLTAMGEIDDKIDGLSVGADDYLTKPFDPRELVLRLQAILRRRPSSTQEAPKLAIGPWVYDPIHKELIDAEKDQSVKLTDGEATLINALAMNLGDVMNRDHLSEACGMDADKRTIDVQVTRLRRKLEQDSNNPRHLQTVRGKGYVLRAERL